MTLGELCGRDLSITVPEDSARISIQKIVTDSRMADDGSLFVCLKGEHQDGHLFMKDAVSRGAKVILNRDSLAETFDDPDVVVLFHPDPKRVLPMMLNRLYQSPSDRIRLTGVTGTNGKTTTSYLLEAVYTQAGISCGVIGTVNCRFAGRVFPAKNTTPGLADNVLCLSQMLRSGVEACVMEASSHALVQGRVEGLHFREAVFMNLTGDHLDYHKTEEEYFLAKAKFFDGSIDIGHAVINIDDGYGRRLRDMSVAPVTTFGIGSQAEVQARDVVLSLDGSRFFLVTPQGEAQIETALIGRHNVSNILAASAVALNEGLSLEQIKQGVGSLKGVPGRLERIEEAGDFFVFVDYAHTEDALKNVLESIRETGAQRILVVFGCGGDRDRTKRPKMAAVVEELADVAIVTNDNPRTEDPQAIARDIIKGFSQNSYEVVLDRSEAIAHALKCARQGDCVLIAGKGHEDYQIFKEETIHFDDREKVRALLKG